MTSKLSQGRLGKKFKEFSNEFFKKKIVGAVAIAASLSFSGVAPVDFAHAGEMNPQLVLCRGDGKEVYSGPSNELQCGALPGSFYLSSTRVNLGQFTNRKSDGIYSAGDRFKISRVYSSHAGGYWKVTSEMVVKVPHC